MRYFIREMFRILLTFSFMLFLFTVVFFIGVYFLKCGKIPYFYYLINSYFLINFLISVLGLVGLYFFRKSDRISSKRIKILARMFIYIIIFLILFGYLVAQYSVG